MDIWFGWKMLPIDKTGMPTDRYTGWEASCFVLFTRVIFVGKVKPVFSEQFYFFCLLFENNVRKART